jgi:hypothetical protein
VWTFSEPWLDSPKVGYQPDLQSDITTIAEVVFEALTFDACLATFFSP